MELASLASENPFAPQPLFPIAYSAGLHEDANEVDFQRKGYSGAHMWICAMRYVNWWQDRVGPEFAKYQTSE